MPRFGSGYCGKPKQALFEESKSVFETIVLAVCLINSPLSCKEVHLQVAPDYGASLQLPFYCARQGQIEAQKWIADHPDWRVARWSCPPNGTVGQKI